MFHNIKEYIKSKVTVPFLYQKRSGGVYTIATIKTENPLNVDVRHVHVLNHNLFKHPSPLQMMADPFVVNDNGILYIFYEELTQKKYAKGADIAVLKSVDGKDWKRIGVAIREPYHLSFPNVFRWHNEYYMIPEGNEGGSLNIYKATNFPLKWKKVSTPLKDIVYSDPMIYVKDELIYLWYNTYLDGEQLKLMYAKDIHGPWIEHPASPIRTDGNDSRPAGTVNEINGRLFYFVQNHDDGYGTGVVAYEIIQLSPKIFVDCKLDKNPFLWKFGDGWAKDGIHQYSMCKIENGEFMCVMDGHKNIIQKGWKWDWRNWPICYKVQ